jgi:hypothetical protein
MSVLGAFALVGALGLGVTAAEKTNAVKASCACCGDACDCSTCCGDTCACCGDACACPACCAKASAEADSVKSSDCRGGNACCTPSGKDNVPVVR